MTYRILFAVFISAILFSCSGSGGYDKTESGLLYTFFSENPDNPQPQPDEIMELDMVYKTETDSVIFDSREIIGSPFRMKLKPFNPKVATVDEGLAMMHVGDSARFVVDAETFFVFTQGREIPKNIKPGSKLIFEIKLKELFNMETYRAQKNESFARDTIEEKTILLSYLKNANITQKPTKSGLYFIEEVKGSGKKPEAGKTVVVHYTGTFINGQIFDSSIQRAEPFEFRFGGEEVIPGMEEGISYMKEGGKATLIIQSKLAYGDKQINKIPPFSTLIFYVELIEVKQ
jgi:peptidylprolyl isomerase